MRIIHEDRAVRRVQFPVRARALLNRTGDGQKIVQRFHNPLAVFARHVTRVRKDAFNPQRPKPGQIGQHLRQAVERQSPSEQTEVDFDVHGHRTGTGRRPVQGSGQCVVVDHDRQAVADHQRSVFGQDRSHHQQGSANTLAPQRERLLEVGHRERIRAMGERHARDLRRAVAVSVRLHHRREFHAGTQALADGADIVPQRAGVHPNPPQEHVVEFFSSARHKGQSFSARLAPGPFRSRRIFLNAGHPLVQRPYQSGE
jgi:hypothetical protein